MRRLGYFQHQEERLLPALGRKATSSIRRRGYLHHQDDRLLQALGE
jgi:hypothetical protein